ncbi:diguanylate cyclase domain-containing protein [Candidatus Magnetominusculus xianensis]|uniref:diguanylate cyclase n=1 Tax=Candidatus Magnetominusculus xianensis TaxID=1748249 RepID=A0ABR5SI65_9BACT|nr:diguanylate cyclase [Candidatus Magnetominusculus xianensis]KWT92029.1 diguanylate cyclase response regulator [Candidatus Magnetominusculus xianensis]MBF0405237.1 diguanylate cyclase [Nitrospirota bacterium]
MSTDKQKILIVDDMPMNIKILNEVLQEDYLTYYATGGRQAIEMAKVLDPDLILLDIIMPEVNGYEVYRAIQDDDNPAGIPIIFITAMDDDIDESYGLNIGAVDYITKPFNPSIVKLRVKNQLELKKQRDILSKLAAIDGLTGISNRRTFDDSYKKEWTRAVRMKSSLSLLLIDIDYFKLYNDSYGHIQGDLCLKKVAETLQACLKRPADLAARYGGEEFVCLLPETNIDGIIQIGSHIRASVEGLKIPHEQSLVSKFITISIGGSEARPTPDISPESFLSHVDNILYQSKKEGRNLLKYDVFR